MGSRERTAYPLARDAGGRVRAGCAQAAPPHGIGAGLHHAGRRSAARARFGAAAFAMLLGGCAVLTPDSGLDVAREVARREFGTEPGWQRSDADAQAARARVDALLARTLTADAAVSVALLNNPSLQAAYAELAVADADRAQAALLPNPVFSYTRVRSIEGHEIDRSIGLAVMSILTLPLRSQIETRRFEAAKIRAAADTVEVALAARRAHVAAVAAQQTAGYMQQVLEAADASRELAARMRQSGNWSELQLVRERLFHAEATAQLARAEAVAFAAREALARVMGVEGTAAKIALAERLPELPPAPRELSEAEQAAIDQRFDVRIARLELDALARNLGLTRATRMINIIEAGPAQVREAHEPNRNGYELVLEIPLFDWGEAKVARAEAVYLQAASRLRETALGARSEVRESYVAYRRAYDVARHYRDEIVPLRKKISDQQLLRYNGMLIGVFELIADAREQVASVNAYIEALRDHFVAEANLRQAVLGRPSMRAGAATPSPAAAAISAGSGSAGGH